eukprot:4992642-Pyramimonas_sp.AAC.1
MKLMWAVLRLPWAPVGQFGGPPRPSWAVLGGLLGPSQGSLGRPSWPYGGCLGAVVGPSWCRCGPSNGLSKGVLGL